MLGGFPRSRRRSYSVGALLGGLAGEAIDLGATLVVTSLAELSAADVVGASRSSGPRRAGKGVTRS